MWSMSILTNKTDHQNNKQNPLTPRVIRKTKVNFVRERFSAYQNRRLTRLLFINDCDEKALSNWKVFFSFLIKI
jgi:hypothetical protein